MSDHVLKALHRFQPSFKGFPRLDEIEKGVVICRLVGNGGIV